jgi:hypothetical protein
VNNLLDGKSVVIVGPSKTLIGQNTGEYIDSFDTVIRMNKSVPLNKDLSSDIGSRTDILYHCLDEPTKSKVNVDNYLEEDIKVVVCSYPPLSFTKSNINRFNIMNKGRLPFRTTDLKVYNDLEKKIKTRPNTGLLTLVDVLSFDIEMVYLTGFCFYRNFYYGGYSTIKEKDYNKVAKSPAHDQDKQMAYWAELYKTDDRIHVDDVLSDLFEQEGLL